MSLSVLDGGDHEPAAAERSLRSLLRDPGTPEPQLVDALLDLIEELAITGPAAVILEDLHWTDPTTIVGIRSITRRLAYLPILMVCTHRPHPKTSELSRLLDAVSREGAITIPLSPLQGSAVIELARDMLGAEVGAGLARTLGMAAGNPLFLAELIQGLNEQGVLRTSDGVADAEVGSLPPTLRLTILRRLSFLPAETIDLLRFATVLGSSFGVEELAILARAKVPAVVGGLAPAVASKVVRERGTRLSFQHDLIHEAIYQDIPAPLRAAMHAEAARGLRSLSVPLTRVAEQLLRGVHVATPEQLDMVTETAVGLRFSAPQIAIGLFQRAIDLLGDQAPVRLRSQILMPLAAVGRGIEAIAMAEQMLTGHHEPQIEARIRLARIEIKMRDGRIAEWIPELVEMGDDERYPDALRRTVRATLASAYVRAGEADAARPVAMRVIAEARAIDDHRSLATGLASLGSADLLSGRPHESIQHLTEAIDLHTERATYLFLGHMQLAGGLAGADRTRDARLAIAEGRRRLQEAGDISSQAPMAATLALIAFLEGAWDEAVVEAKTALELVAEGVGSPVNLLMAHATLAQTRLRRGDLEGATQKVREARRLLSDKGPTMLPEAIDWSEALCREAAGDLPGADRCLAGWEASAGRYWITWRLVTPDLVRLALATGKIDRARAVTEQAEEGARRADGVASAEGAALRCKGLLEDDPQALVAAADAYRRSPWGFERALTCADAATALARAGKRADARTLCDEALEFFDQVGDVRDAARVTAAMRAAGIRRGSKAPLRRPATGWAALTSSEREVARLASEGLTNPQIAERLFISKYTVMTHLSHVFQKLGLASRVELAAAAARAEEQSGSAEGGGRAPS